jgi:hypothetical protein
MIVDSFGRYLPQTVHDHEPVAHRAPSDPLMASQGWPFPSGLMIGFRATATAETVSVDGEEVLEARWFTRTELAEYAASGGRLGREDSIDRYLLHSWLAEDS